MLASKITAKSVNRDSLPTHQQVREVMDQFYLFAHDFIEQNSENWIHQHLDYWYNSTKVQGVREARIRVIWSVNQDIVDQTIGKFLSFVQGKLPAGSYLVYSFAWPVKSGFKARNNCAKVYYRSTQR